MADFTKTVSNSMNVFGVEQPSVWGSMVWGTDNWGYGQTTALSVEKNLDAESITPTDDYFLDSEKYIDNSLPSTFEMSSETLQDAKGYFYVFTKPTTNSDVRNNAAYTESGGNGTSWTEATPNDSDWTEQ